MSNPQNKEKRKPSVSLENAVLIGNGFYADVYRLDDDKIVKVLRDEVSLAEAQREAALSKAAFFHGLPTPISYDTVMADGKPALMYEFLNCYNLKDSVNRYPENFDRYMKQYAALLHYLAETDVGDLDLPDAKAVKLESMGNIRPFFSEEEYAKIMRLIESIPAAHTFVHGDCQAKNVKVYHDEMYLIDLDTLAFGNPIFDLCDLYEVYKIFYEADAAAQEKFMGLSEETAARILEAVLNEYFAGLSPEDAALNKKKVAMSGHLFLLQWLLECLPEKEKEIAVCTAYIHENLGTLEDLALK